MAKERNALKVGIVTVAVVVGSFAILLWISRSVGGELQQITVSFQSSPAMPTLVPGSAVLVGGPKGRPGQQRSVGIADPQGQGRRGAQSGIPFDRDSGDRKAACSRSDCQVFAEGPPLGGDGIVKIDLGKAKEAIKPGQVIQGAEPAGFGAILASLQGEFDGNKPSSLMGQIKSQLDPNGQKSLMAKLLQSANDINAVTSSLSKELRPEEKATLLAMMHEIMDNISTATAALRAEVKRRSLRSCSAKCIWPWIQ